MSYIIYRNLHHVWIGLSDNQKEGTFVGKDGLVSLTYTNWGPNEPSNSRYFGGRSISENCVELMNSNGKWNDQICFLDRSFICQKGKIL